MSRLKIVGQTLPTLANGSNLEIAHCRDQEGGDNALTPKVLLRPSEEGNGQLFVYFLQTPAATTDFDCTGTCANEAAGFGR